MITSCVLLLLLLHAAAARPADPRRLRTGGVIRGDEYLDGSQPPMQDHSVHNLVRPMPAFVRRALEDDFDEQEKRYWRGSNVLLS